MCSSHTRFIPSLLKYLCDISFTFTTRSPGLQGDFAWSPFPDTIKLIPPTLPLGIAMSISSNILSVPDPLQCLHGSVLLDPDP